MDATCRALLRRSGPLARPKLRQSTACRIKPAGQAPTTTSQEPSTDCSMRWVLSDRRTHLSHMFGFDNDGNDERRHMWLSRFVVRAGANPAEKLHEFAVTDRDSSVLHSHGGTQASPQITARMPYRPAERLLRHRARCTRTAEGDPAFRSGRGATRCTVQPALRERISAPHRCPSRSHAR